MAPFFKPISTGSLTPFAKGGTGECYRLDALKRIVLLKKLRFEVLYGSWYSPEYGRAIRDEVPSSFQEGGAE